MAPLTTSLETFLRVYSNLTPQMVFKTRLFRHLKLLQWNANGVRCRKDELLQLFQSEDVDVALLSDALDSGRSSSTLQLHKVPSWPSSHTRRWSSYSGAVKPRVHPQT
ncbi:hypothetical protein Zmor_022082 [Zophobas morio]|jgi:hypothetical protein|uniref:Uncharacterized protein n=1 Tax=Zophobas morio TaxID=2755281 RepID=A0AA38HIW1_9CUCU|nr:hypothetical protein Zmor_022082 [Zophobas morio]